LAESERSIWLIISICAEDGGTRTDYSCMMASTRSVIVDTHAIMRNILVIRGQRVLLDSDLAALYQVATKALTRAVRRNPGRFPADFTDLRGEMAMYPYVAPHTAKIHTLITLGISIRRKPLVLWFRQHLPLGSIPIARSTFRCLACPCEDAPELMV
jgi:hypothetical protein